jgi:pentatricopeptide repeat protein
VISSNIASWEASVKRMERKELDDNARSFHALHWLLYGYLQQGRFAKAEQIMYDMMKYTAEEPDRGARSYIVSMKGTYLVDSDDWDNAEITAMTTDLSDLNIRSRAAYHFMEGYKAYLARNEQQLIEAINQMKKEQKAAANVVTVEGIPMCSAAGLDRNQPNQLDIDQAKVMTLELEAYRAMLRNQNEDVERLLKEATELEASISYSYGPPSMILPSYELYGEWLLSQDRPREAAAQIDYALAKAPRRLRSLKGRLNAAIAANELEKEMEIRATLKETLHQADEEVRSSILDQGQLSSLE